MTKLEEKRIEVSIAETIANTAKLNAETAKLQKETFWYPLALATGLILAVAAVVKYMF